MKSLDEIRKMNAPVIARPTIHLNGTSREALIEQYEIACAGLRNALDALRQMRPHEGQHEDREARVLTVLEEIESIWRAVVEGGDR